MITKNPNPQVLVSHQEPKPYLRLLSLFPISRTEEKPGPSTELALATTSSRTTLCRQDNEVSTTLTLGLPSFTTKKRKAVDQNPTPINPKRQEVILLNANKRRDEERDPWKIKKRLTTSDLGNLCRLLVPKQLVEKHVLPFWDDLAIKRAKSDKGVKVRVHDRDMNSTHQLVFKFLRSSESYVFNKRWRPKFVRERMLKLNEKIGLYWDAENSMFMFSVIDRVNQPVVHQG